MAWALHHRVTLHHRLIDGACILYQEESGDTHLFHPICIYLLEILEKGPAEEADIQEKLDATSELDSNELGQQISLILQNLEHFGVVERQ